MINQAYGAAGESLAADFLKNKGYKILTQNFRTRTGEIDIIAFYKGFTIFVEVKSRATLKFGRPCLAVTLSKQNSLRRAATVYLMQTGKYETACRFDVIEIMENKILNHIENAF